MKAHVIPVLAGKPHHLFSSFARALSQAPAGSYVRAAFAYTTIGGVQEFLSQGSSVGNWAARKKQFLVGIHHAISEPHALEILRSTPNVELRVVVPGQKLRLSAFDESPVFHPKVFAITGGGDGQLMFLQAGSANMSAAATAVRPRNHEFSVALQAEGAGYLDAEKRFNHWWTSLWDHARPVDRAFITKYAELRNLILQRNPILRYETEAPSGIEDAEIFFAEVGAGSGPPGWRHQIEFPESLARFFGEPKHHRRDLTLRRGGQSWVGRPLSYKRTTYNVEIWRLGMPTQHSGGDPVADRAIWFKRTADPETFEFRVVDSDTAEFKEWVRLANLKGHLGATRGQRARQYGFY